MTKVQARVDSKIRMENVPTKLGNALGKLFNHANPDYWRAQNMGFSTWNIPSKIKTFKREKNSLELPRGGLEKVIAECEDLGFELEIEDCRTRSEDTPFPIYRPLGRDDTELRPYQKRAIERCMEEVQGIVRAPTGSGKTALGLAFIGQARQRALVVVRAAKIQKQWVERAQKELGLRADDICIVKGGVKYKEGRKLVVALQQSLYAQGKKMTNVLQEQFGTVVVDEVHEVAARTFMNVIDRTETYYRIGLSADERRKDGKEFLIYDLFGDPIYEIPRAELEKQEIVKPVMARAIETEFYADWYRNADPSERDFGTLVREMEDDDHRHGLILALIKRLLERKEYPILVFTHHRDYAKRLHDDIQRFAGKCGLLLGGDGESSARFDADRDLMLDGKLDVAVGTYKAVGTGIDIPSVRAGICATPIGNNPQFFNQVRGRVCRASEGDKFLYYIWDRAVFPYHLRNLHSWNYGKLEVRGDGFNAGWVPYQGY